MKYIQFILIMGFVLLAGTANSLITPGGCTLDVWTNPTPYTDEVTINDTFTYLSVHNLEAEIFDYDGGEPLSSFNCHGFAIHMFLLGEDAAWIRFYDPYFDETTFGCKPTLLLDNEGEVPGHITKYTGHSGIALGGSFVLSKWGRLAVLEHAAWEVPSNYQSISGYYYLNDDINVLAAENKRTFNSCTDLTMEIFDPWKSVEYLFEGSNDLHSWELLTSAEKKRREYIYYFLGRMYGICSSYRSTGNWWVFQSFRTLIPVHSGQPFQFYPDNDSSSFRTLPLEVSTVDYF